MKKSSTSKLCFVAIVLLLATIPFSPAAFADSYVFHFTNSDGTIPPITGGFDYDPLLGFKNFVVVWTNPEPVPFNYGNFYSPSVAITFVGPNWSGSGSGLGLPPSACVPSDDAAGTFFFLSNPCSAASWWWGGSGTAYDLDASSQRGMHFSAEINNVLGMEEATNARGITWDGPPCNTIQDCSTDHYFVPGWDDTYSGTWTLSRVPEPTTLTLLLAGALGLGLGVKTRHR